MNDIDDSSKAFYRPVSNGFVTSELTRWPWSPDHQHAGPPAALIGCGPVAAWMRMRVPLVAGETPSPLQRVLTAADSGNDIGLADTRLYDEEGPIGRSAQSLIIQSRYIS